MSGAKKLGKAIATKRRTGIQGSKDTPGTMVPRSSLPTRKWKYKNLKPGTVKAQVRDPSTNTVSTVRG